ncbi:MAG TPA: DUF4412 domain-containing protein [Gemmatimonadaceae bacterium]|nr:DUF4412 domain-containing protein [Gemmatimonadaceae bacterium]
MAHRFARAPLTAVLAAFTAAAPLGAQWQGVVNFKSQQDVANQGRTSDVQYMEGSGGMAKMTMQHEETGPVSMIFNKNQNTATIVMTSRQMYMTMPMDRAQAEVQKQMAKSKITDTGKSEVVAGHKCEIFHASDAEDSTETDACVASDMGTFMMFQGPGSESRGGGAASFLSKAQSFFGAKGGFFPLKVTIYKGGKVDETFVATSIEAKSVPASEFTPPAGFTAMPGMGRP